jgi:hypothetical protein
MHKLLVYTIPDGFVNCTLLIGNRARLALALLVLWVLADHAHNAAPLDDFALFTTSLH